MGDPLEDELDQTLDYAFGEANEIVPKEHRFSPKK
jgi:hypothetical protein